MLPNMLEYTFFLDTRYISTTKQIKSMPAICKFDSYSHLHIHQKLGTTTPPQIGLRYKKKKKNSLHLIYNVSDCCPDIHSASDCPNLVTHSMI